MRVLGVVCASTLVTTGAAYADVDQPTDDAAAPAPADSAAAPEQKYHWQPGPKPVNLGHGIKLDLPETHAYLPMPEAGELMKKMGNLYNDDLLGLVVSQNDADEYLVTLRFEDSGHIKDDESLDSKELLESMQEGEEEYNAERKKLGFSPMHAAGWDEEPHYDKVKHELIWGLIIEAPDGGSINYNTRILGRSGFVSLNLVTDKQHLAAYKPAGALLLSKTGFEPGQRYADFNSSTDKVAEYGLTGLVLGGAGLGLMKVAKIGLLAKFGKGLLALLIAGKKAIVAAAVALGAALKKLFSKKENAAT
ncbi:MAG TPA: DUF2167 domain-containing protein [Polyangiaceae bacterium]|nr:DUF2167 domain-containing protein [Polyangiaceae bacterium]